MILYLNQPAVKAGVKQALGMVALALGCAQLYSGWTDDATLPRWQRIALQCAQLSLLLSAATSPLGAWLIGAIAPTPLASLFGVNTIFAINPWHPRHICSIAATLLALPSLLTHTRWQSLAASWNALTGRPAQHLANRMAWAIVVR